MSSRGGTRPCRGNSAPGIMLEETRETGRQTLTILGGVRVRRQFLRTWVVCQIVNLINMASTASIKSRRLTRQAHECRPKMQGDGCEDSISGFRDSRQIVLTFSLMGRWRRQNVQVTRRRCSDSKPKKG